MVNKVTVPVVGMHCSACELLTEKELSKLSGVTKVKANHHSGQVEIEYSASKIDDKLISEAIARTGYQVGQEKLAWLSNDVNDYLELMIAVSIFMALYLFISLTGLDGLASVEMGSAFSLPMALLIGLTAGLSTCMALVGGLVLGLAANYVKQNQSLTSTQKFKPHVVFNLGRIIGYGILGAVLGVMGSASKISASFNGWLTLIVALVMVALGIKLLKIFPAMQKYDIAMPKFISRWLPSNLKAKRYSHWQAAFWGALTFFVPCGFTQAMQIYALNSGSAWQGSLVMTIFALGTAPGLLSLGGLVSIIKGKTAGVFFRLAGLAVIFFAVFNLNNGYNLIKVGGLDLLSWVSSSESQANLTNKVASDGVQIIEMTQGSRGYSPNKFSVRVGQKVRWIITSTNARSCASALVVPKLNINQQLKQGENIIEFTPDRAGVINFSCSMGMYSGSIEVLDQDGELPAPDSAVINSSQVNPDSTAHQCGGSCGGACGSKSAGCDGSCGCGKKASTNAEVKTEIKEPSTDIKNPTTPVKVLKASYNNTAGLRPNEFQVSKGERVSIEVYSEEDGQGCMSTIMIPGLDDRIQDLLADKVVKLNFNAKESGRFMISCAMNVPHGFITVN